MTATGPVCDVMCYVISTFKSEKNANSDSLRTSVNDQCSVYVVPYDSLQFYEDATVRGQVKQLFEKRVEQYTLATRAKTHYQQLY